MKSVVWFSQGESAQLVIIIKSMSNIDKVTLKLKSHICILLKVSCLQILANNLQDYKYITD